MKKKNFVTLILSTIGGILFALGMCMCLLPSWNAFSQGVAAAIAGVIVLLVMGIIRRRMSGKPGLGKPNGKTIGAVVLGVAGALVFGVGMCMTMVWEGLMIPGIIVGVAGIVVLLCLIPLCRGLKD